MSTATNCSFCQPPLVYAEGTWLHGAIVTAALYGIVVVLYAMCAHSLWHRIWVRRSGNKKDWFFFLYVNFIFIVGTVYVAFNSQITQLGFINHRDYPGGPSAYESNTSSPPLNVAFVVSNWCADALMIWRCIVVYRDSRLHIFVTVIGSLLFVASVVTGSLWVVIVSKPTQSTSGWMSFSFLFPYLSVSLGINILICILTVLRLLYHRRNISKVLGPAYGMLYASFAAVIVESASVYAICSLLYIIPYAANSPLANAFLQILGEAQIIAPLLIIYRVSEGKAWTRDFASRLPMSGSHALHRISTQPQPTTPTIGTQRTTPKPLQIQVDFEVSKRAEDGSIHSAIKEDSEELSTASGPSDQNRELEPPPPP